MKRYTSFEHPIKAKKLVGGEYKELIVGVWTIELESEDEDTYRVTLMQFKGNPDYKYDYSPVAICLDYSELETLVSEFLFGYYQDFPNPPKSRDPWNSIFQSIGSICSPQTLES